MAVTTSARRAIRVSARKRILNLRRLKAMRDSAKGVRLHVAAGKKKDAEAELRAAYKAIDKALKRGILKKNTAARRKSKLARLLGQAK